MVELRVSAEKGGLCAFCILWVFKLGFLRRIVRHISPNRSIFAGKQHLKMCARRAAATVTARHLS